MYVNKSLIGKYVNNNKEYRESYKFLKGSRFLSKFFGKIKIKRTRAKYRFKSKKNLLDTLHRKTLEKKND